MVRPLPKVCVQGEYLDQKVEVICTNPEIIKVPQVGNFWVNIRQCEKCKEMLKVYDVRLLRPYGRWVWITITLSLLNKIDENRYLNYVEFVMNEDEIMKEKRSNNKFKRYYELIMERENKRKVLYFKANPFVETVRSSIVTKWCCYYLSDQGESIEGEDSSSDSDSLWYDPFPGFTITRYLREYLLEEYCIKEYFSQDKMSFCVKFDVSLRDSEGNKIIIPEVSYNLVSHVKEAYMHACLYARYKVNKDKVELLKGDESRFKERFYKWTSCYGKRIYNPFEIRKVRRYFKWENYPGPKLKNQYEDSSRDSLFRYGVELNPGPDDTVYLILILSALVTLIFLSCCYRLNKQMWLQEKDDEFEYLLQKEISDKIELRDPTV